MSEWNHAICDSCWKQREPDREPYRLKQREIRRCCYCGVATLGGILLRQDPQEVACRGQHE